MRFILTRVLPLLVLIWLVGDFVYSRVVLYRLDRWEATVARDAEGIQQGHREYSAGEGSTALLLVHGINFSPYVFKNLVPQLAEQGFYCRAMRLPGFALPVRQYAQHRYPQWVAAVADEVAALKRDHPHVVIVAHSLGGAVTVRTLLERELEIDGVVLIAPAIDVSSARSPLGLPTRFWHEFGRWTLLFTRIVESPFAYDLNDPAALRQVPQQPYMPRAIVDQTYAMIDANRGRAAELKQPLLMVLAPDDRIVDTPTAKAYFQAWGSPDKQLVIQEGAAHMIPLDFGWESLVPRISEFARRVAQKPAGQRAYDDSANQ
jgi:esterase/lipase